ncbi:hypothetical protein MRX96_020759 [Rhipicephalus microplus]
MGNLLNHLGRPRTFFSVMEHSFNDLSPATGIPTEQFLNSCRSILAVFDVLGSTAFVPVKMDIQGNIGKLQARYETDPSNFDQLFDMVRQEIDSGANTARNSVTDALLWLSRALAFIHAFLEQIQSGNAVLADCASCGVRHHPQVPPRLGAEDLQHPDYRRQLFADGGAYVQALQEVLDALNNFYVQNGLEPPVQKS